MSKIKIPLIFAAALIAGIITLFVLRAEFIAAISDVEHDIKQQGEIVYDQN